MVGGSREIVPVRILLQAAAFCRGSHRHLATEQGRQLKWSRGRHIQQESSVAIEKYDGKLCILQCKKVLLI